jgi:Cys-rich four helix bundle protein (predicted Tat secretion target)
MFRRQVIQGLPALLGALAVSNSLTLTDAAAAVRGGLDQALIDATLDCMKRGEICAAHCVTMLELGDRTLADCQRRVSETVVVCRALASLAAQESSATKQMARVVLEVCGNCERECRKFAKQHALCKECADACAACARECKRVIT